MSPDSSRWGGITASIKSNVPSWRTASENYYRQKVITLARLSHPLDQIHLVYRTLEVYLICEEAEGQSAVRGERKV